MSHDDYRDPLPHPGDCTCRICMTCGAGWREEDIWRDPEHEGIVRRRSKTNNQHAYQDKLTERILQLQAQFAPDLERRAREQLQAEGWEA